jgi:hypothetical protein
VPSAATALALADHWALISSRVFPKYGDLGHFFGIHYFGNNAICVKWFEMTVYPPSNTRIDGIGVGENLVAMSLFFKLNERISFCHFFLNMGGCFHINFYLTNI